MGFEVRIIQAGFLEQRDFNGGTAGYPGPAAYLGKNLDHALPIEFKAWMACLVITNWFCDSILVRYLQRPPPPILTRPALALHGSLPR